MFNFQQEKIIITGASKSLGYVCTRALEKERAKLVLMARFKDKLEALKNSFLNHSKTLKYRREVLSWMV